GEPKETASNAIVGGSVDDGHPSAGMLVKEIDGKLYFVCSATYIGGPSAAVLTAAHCLDEGERAMFYKKGVAQVWGMGHQDPAYDSKTKTHDVSVLTLESVPDGVPASQVAASVPSEGEGVTLVGFGITCENCTDAQTQRYANTAIAVVTDDEL